MIRHLQNVRLLQNKDLVSASDRLTLEQPCLGRTSPRVPDPIRSTRYLLASAAGAGHSLSPELRQAGQADGEIEGEEKSPCGQGRPRPPAWGIRQREMK